MRDKNKITEELVQQLDPDLGITFRTALHSWWFNFRKNGGMRLTGPGYKVFCDLKYAHYEFPLDDPHQITQHTILALDRKIQMPYYIHSVKGIPKKIVFFGSQEAVMVNLYGNLNNFLNNYRP